MNSLERLGLALNGQFSDRTPVMAVLGTWGSRLTGVGVQDLYRDGTAWVNAQIALQSAFGFDLVLAPFDYSVIAETWGGEVVWFSDQVPNLKRPASEDPEWFLQRGLPVPCKRQAQLIETTRRLADRFGGTVPVMAVLPGPASLPNMLLGIETWMETMLFQPSLATRLMDLTDQFWLGFCDDLFHAGATAIVVTEGMAASEMLDRPRFVQQVLPRLSAVFGKVGGPLVLHHTGGSIGHVLDQVAGLPALAGVALGFRDDLATARQVLGAGPLILGNIDNVSFADRGALGIRQDSLRCLQAMAGDPGYILANSGADIPLAADRESIQALLDAALDMAAGNIEGALS